MVIRHDEEVLYFSSSTLVMLARSGTYYVVFRSFETKSLASVHFSAPLSKGLQDRQRKKAPAAAEFSSMCVSYFHSSPCRDNMAGASGILPSLRIMEMNSSRPPSMMCTCEF